MFDHISVVCDTALGHHLAGEGRGGGGEGVGWVCKEAFFPGKMNKSFYSYSEHFWTESTVLVCGQRVTD